MTIDEKAEVAKVVIELCAQQVDIAADAASGAINTSPSEVDRAVVREVVWALQEAAKDIRSLEEAHRLPDVLKELG